MIWCACGIFLTLIDEFGYKHALYKVAILIYCVFATFVTSSNGGKTQFLMFQTS